MKTITYLLMIMITFMTIIIYMQTIIIYSNEKTIKDVQHTINVITTNEFSKYK